MMRRKYKEGKYDKVVSCTLQLLTVLWCFHVQVKNDKVISRHSYHINGGIVCWPKP